MRRWCIALVLIVVLGAASAAGAAVSGWSLRKTPNPASAPRWLTGVSCTSASACTAVGYYNKRQGRAHGTKTLAERWNGG